MQRTHEHCPEGAVAVDRELSDVLQDQLEYAMYAVDPGDVVVVLPVLVVLMAFVSILLVNDFIALECNHSCKSRTLIEVVVIVAGSEFVLWTDPL